MTTRLSLSLAACAAVGLLSAPLTAQQAPSRPSAPRAASDRTAHDQARDDRAGREMVTRRGCLAKAESVSATGMAAVWELRPSTLTAGSALTLVTLPDSTVDLAAHDGRHVEVRGRERHEGLASHLDDKPRVQGGQMQDVGQAATLPPPVGARPSDEDERGPALRFEVHAVKTLAETCPAP